MIGSLTGKGADVVQKKHKGKVLSKKTIDAIFGYKQSLLSIDMKTKVVQNI